MNTKRLALAFVLVSLFAGCGSQIPEGYVEVRVKMGGQSPYLFENLTLKPMSYNKCVPTRLAVIASGINPPFVIKKVIPSTVTLDLATPNLANLLSEPLDIPLIIPKGSDRFFQIVGYLQDADTCGSYSPRLLSGIKGPLNINGPMNIGIEAWIAANSTYAETITDPLTQQAPTFDHPNTFVSVYVKPSFLAYVPNVSAEIHDLGLMGVGMNSIATLSPTSINPLTTYLKVSPIAPLRVYRIDYSYNGNSHSQCFMSGLNPTAPGRVRYFDSCPAPGSDDPPNTEATTTNLL